MSQTTLTEDAPLVLDSTCSFGKVWPAFATIRMDKRKEVRPDIVADARLSPFRDSIFERVYCDPPHIIRKSEKNQLWDIVKAYGVWKTRHDWLDFVSKTNVEFRRILKRDGQLHYKITDGVAIRGDTGGATHLRELSLMSNFEITSDKQRDSQIKFTGSKSKVHYLVMKPK